MESVKLRGQSFDSLEHFSETRNCWELREFKLEVPTFSLQKACYICFPYISTMRKTNLRSKFSVDFQEFRNSGIYGIAGIWIWSKLFVVKSVLHVFSIYIEREKNESVVKILLGFSRIPCQNCWNLLAVLNTFLLCKNKKCCAQLKVSVSRVATSQSYGLVRKWLRLRAL